jgi:hypothetical protein
VLAIFWTRWRAGLILETPVWPFFGLRVQLTRWPHFENGFEAAGEMLLGRARDGSVRVSESKGERIDVGQRAWQRIVTCLAVFFLPKIEPGRLPMLDPVVAPPMFLMAISL